jgi:hypothetical protein
LTKYEKCDNISYSSNSINDDAEHNSENASGGVFMKRKITAIVLSLLVFLVIGCSNKQELVYKPAEKSPVYGKIVWVCNSSHSSFIRVETPIGEKVSILSIANLEEWQEKAEKHKSNGEYICIEYKPDEKRQNIITDISLMLTGP